MYDSARKKKENIIMSESKQNFSIEVEGKRAVCPLGEVVGKKMIAEERIPVISCEGGCFRGEIARVALSLAKNQSSLSVFGQPRILYTNVYAFGLKCIDLALPTAVLSD